MSDKPPVWFVGAGPGDPGLLTVSGLEALRGSSSVVAPASFQRSFARWLEGRELLSPFTLEHAAVVRWIEERLPLGPVAFLVPGDLSTFCPFQSFVAHFGSRARVVPGVSSAAAAAAVLRKTFDLAGVAHATILTSPRAYVKGGERVSVRAYARPGHTLVLYMNDLPLEALVGELRAGFGRDVPMAILENLGCPDERVTRGTLDTMAERVGDRDPFGLDTPGAEPTLALVVAGEVLGADEDPSWWDRRVVTLWRPRGLR